MPLEMRAKVILGISAYYHDSAAALLVDGKLTAAVQEERFSRLKHDPAFPVASIRYCLSQTNIPLEQFNAVVFYDKPFLTFDRLFESYMSFAPKGLRSFIQRMPVWLKEKLLLKKTLRKQLAQIGGCPINILPPLLFTEHHQSQAASAFYPSPFSEAVVLCMDGVGEWATTSAWIGNDNQLKPLWQINFPDSLGLLYSAFTYFCGFKVNSGEYKLMGLAPYGKPVYQEIIESRLITIKADGSFKLDMQFFDYIVGEQMTNTKFASLFDGPRRQPESAITQRECDLAASIQAVTEKIVLKLAKTLKTETGCNNLCLAGGVALNCVANGKLTSSGLFKGIWIQPAAGDAGGAVGAAYTAWFSYFENSRFTDFRGSMSNSYLGPEFRSHEIDVFLKQQRAVFTTFEDKELVDETARLISTGNVIGWFQGQMEFGPRALGHRSILADPTNPNMQSRLNQKIKFRESFRPFAPSVTEEQAQKYFSFTDDQPLTSSPYMLAVASIQNKWLLNHDQPDTPDGIKQIHAIRSKLPAITHVDNTARVQTVNAKDNPRYHALLKAFEIISGFPVLINTSFNIRGEPIVCSPEDAWRCFMVTDMDYLVIGNFILDKKKQVVQNREHFVPEVLIMD